MEGKQVGVFPLSVQNGRLSNEDLWPCLNDIPSKEAEKSRFLSMNKQTDSFLPCQVLNLLSWT